MLAAPILALGLPTLIILNMADDLRNRGGTLDLTALSGELGAPVALVSARQGEGIDEVFEFPGRAPWPSRRPGRCRCCTTSPSAASGPGAWAAEADYRAPIAAQVDAPAGSPFSCIRSPGRWFSRWW